MKIIPIFIYATMYYCIHIKIIKYFFFIFKFNLIKKFYYLLFFINIIY